MNRNIPYWLIPLAFACVPAASGGGAGSLAQSEAGPRDTTVYDTLALTQQPERLRFPPPEYPRTLLQTGVTGEVHVSFIIGTDGRVEKESMQVVRATEPLFIKPTLDALAKARFKPGSIDGRPVRVRTTMPLRYVICTSPDTVWARPGARPPLLPRRPCR